MLAKLEDIYLNILRIAVLAIATVALVVFVLTAAQTAPLMGQFIGIQPKAKVENATFAEFVSSNTSSTSSGDYGPSTETIQNYPVQIRSAGIDIAAYVNRHHGYQPPHADVVRFLGSLYDSMSPPYQADYADSLEAFADQLNSSTGTPISPSQIDEAIRWHAEKFSAAANQSEQKAIADRAKSMLAVTIAGISLMAFLIIIFLFVVVKIERNLRVVRVQKTEAPLS